MKIVGQGGGHTDEGGHRSQRPSGLHITAPPADPNFCGIAGMGSGRGSLRCRVESYSDTGAWWCARLGGDALMPIATYSNIIKLAELLYFSCFACPVFELTS